MTISSTEALARAQEAARAFNAAYAAIPIPQKGFRPVVVVGVEPQATDELGVYLAAVETEIADFATLVAADRQWDAAPTTYPRPGTTYRARTLEALQTVQVALWNLGIRPEEEKGDPSC